MPIASLAGIIATPTRIIYTTNNEKHTLVIKNESESTFLASAIFGEKGQPYFTITPPIIKLKAYDKNILRVRGIDTQKLPNDRESVFNYSITIIASDDNKPLQQNRITMANRYWFKLFYRPVNIGKPQLDVCDLTFIKSKGKLDVKNNSPFFSTLVFLSTNGKRIYLSPDEAMIAPYSSQQIDISSDVKIVEWIRINDYGSLEKKCTSSLM